MARRLRHNLLSLLVNQGGQYLASLILLPVLTRRLGLDGYGELGFCLAVVGYLGLLVEWGYVATSTKQIAIFKEDVREYSRVFWGVWCGKSLLLVFAAFLLWVFLDLNWLVIGDHRLLWMAFLMVVANSLAPNFLFHGLEKLDLALGVNIGFRFLSIPFVLLFVHDASDVTVAQGIVSVTLLLSTMTNLFLLKRLRLVCWVKPTFLEIVGAMKIAAPLFLSTAAQGFFASSLTVVLGYTSGAGAVGAYTAAINLYKAAQGMFILVSQTVYPRLSSLFHHDMPGGIRMLRRILLVQAPITGIVCALMAWVPSWLLPLFVGHQFDASVQLFQLLTVALFLYSMTTLLGLQLMVLVNCYSLYTKTVLLAVGASLIAAYVMNIFWGAIGSVLAIIISEASILVLSLVYLKQQLPLVFKALFFKTEKSL